MNEEKEEQDRTLKDDIEDKAKKQAKKSFKMMVKAIISTVVTPLIPYFIVAVIIAGFVIGLFDILASAADNENADVVSKEVIKEQVEIEKNLDGEYYFKINNTIIDEYLKELSRVEEKGQSEEEEEKESEDKKEDYKFDEESIAEIRRKLENIFGTENFEPYLVKMIRAEIASSYPKLSDYVGESIDGIDETSKRHNKQKNKVDTRGNFVGQGIVKIKRTQVLEDGTVQPEKELKYIPYESEDEGEQTFKSMIQSQNIEVLDYYSFSQEKGIIYYATYRKTADGTTLTEGQASYKSVASMCSMPFNFLFSLLQTSKNPEWIMALCDLVLEQSQDREVIIMIQDQITKTVTTETRYSVIMTEKQGYIVDEFGRVLADGQTSYHKELGNPEVTQTVTIQNTANVYIQKANTWCLDFEQKAKIEAKENHTENEYNIEVGDATYGEPTFDSGGMNTDVAGSYETTKTSISNEKYLGKTTTDTTTYTAEIESEKEKEINHNRFLGLWKNDKGEYYEDCQFDEEGKLVGYEMEKGGKRYPPKDISERNEQRIDILLELLAKHEDTQIQEQLMMHFWNIYMGEDIYEVDVDSLLDLFNTKVMISANGTASGSLLDLIRRSIAYYEGETPKRMNSEGKECYVVVGDPYANGLLTVGPGLTTYVDQEHWDKAGIDRNTIMEGQLIEVEKVQTVKESDIKARLEIVKGMVPGLKDYQYAALTIGHYNSPALVSSFARDYASNWKETDDKYGEPIPYQIPDGSIGESNQHRILSEAIAAVNHPIYSNTWGVWCNAATGMLPGLVRRRFYEWMLFQYGYDVVTDTYYVGGANLNNPDGSVSEEAALSFQQQLAATLGIEDMAQSLTLDVGSALRGLVPGNLNTTSRYYGPEANIYTASSRDLIWQCTWWACGRAGEILEQLHGYTKGLPTNFSGDGGTFYERNLAGGYFNYSPNVPKANSIITWKEPGQWGHVAIVEAVDEVNGCMYISHAGNGNAWFGISKIDISGYIWSGYQLQGYVYLDEPTGLDVNS